MIRTSLKKLTFFVPPVIILAVAYLALPRIQQLSPPHLELAQYVPYLVLLSGIFLSTGFNRGRVFYVLLILGLFYWCFRDQLQQGITGHARLLMFQAFAVLLPCNITFFCLIRERGIFSSSGRMRLGFILLQVIVTAWIIRYRIDYDGIAGFFGREFVKSPLLDGLVIPQLALAAMMLGALLIGYRVLKWGYPVDSGMLGVLAAAGIACNWLWTPQNTVVFTTAAAFILAVSVIQDSHNMAFRDDLTGLPSRRALNEQLMGLGKRYTMAMLDVDHFKKFNDTYGHDIGDQVLKMVGGKIGSVRGGGRPFRYGGEEFTVIFPGKDPKEVIPHLEELRKNIASYQLRIRSNDRPRHEAQGKQQRGTQGGKETVSVTISIGVAGSSEDLRKPEDVIRQADKALYRAKERGRNQVCT